MAGSVVVGIVYDGQLQLNGDWQDNAVVLWKGAQPGQVVVAGAKDNLGRNTMVNGHLQPVTFSGVKHIGFTLRSGNDRILFTNLSLPPSPGSQFYSVLGNLGEGNDQMVVSGNTGTPRAFTLNTGTPIPYGDVDFSAGAAINGGPGNDTMSVVSAEIDGRSLTFNGGNGNDAFFVDGSMSENQFATIGLRMGAGNNTVSIKRANIAASLLMSDAPASPNALVSSSVSLFNVRLGQQLIVSLYGNNSTVSIDSDADPAKHFHARSVDISAFKGNNQFSVRRAESDLFVMGTRSGNNRVSVLDSVFDKLLVGDGDGDSALTVGGVTTTERTRFDGGAGTDTFTDLGGNSFANLEFFGFEE